MVHRNFALMRRPRSSSPRRGKNRWMIEILERRELLTTTWTVNSTTDAGTGSGTSGDLRWCIEQVNLTTGSQTIDFAITGAGVQTIKLNSPLPTINKPVTIDGTSEGTAMDQSGYTGTPLIELDGTALTMTQTALTVDGGGSTIQALAIDNSPGTALALQAHGGDTVLGCFIGTTAAGTTAAANGVGIDISGCSNNTVGGTGTDQRNIISANTSSGIVIGDLSASNANVILGNYIGTDITGMTALGNKQNGIVLAQSSNNTIGGTATGAGNVISGNGLDGIDATGTGTGDVIQGNLVGTSTQPTGQGLQLSKGFAGMQYNDTPGYVPPDTTEAVGQTNVIEAVNTTMRIFQKSGTVVSTTQLSNFFPNAVANNLGTPAVFYDDILKRFVVAALEEDETAADSYLDIAFSDVGNETSFWNVYRFSVQEGSNFADALRFGFNANAIVLTFNMYNASSLNFSNVQILSIDPTSIGLSNLSTVTLDRSNDFGDVPALMHGATASDPMYFVEANNQFTAPYDDVHVLTWANPLNASSSFTDTDITVPTYDDPTAANQLGTTNQIYTGSIQMLSTAWRNNSLVAADNTDNTSGDPNARWYEFSTAQSTPTLVQSGNIDQGSGVATYFPSIDIDPSGDIGMTFMESSSTEYMSMYVTGQIAGLTNGTMLTPVLAQAGVAPYTSFDTPPYVAGFYSATSVDPTDGSFWSANEYAVPSQPESNWGTWIQQFSVQTGNSFKYIGLGNKSNGIVLNGPTNVLIGGTMAAAANIIGDNAGDGIQILGSSSSVQVEGNFIGTDPKGDGSLGNVGNGVTVLTSQNSIGGTTAAAGNVISGNSLDGILLSQVGGGATSSGNLVEWNTIGTAPNGTVALPNLKQGIHLEAVNGTSILNNLVSGNEQNGIMLDIKTISFTSYGNSDTLIQGNTIGTDITGSTPLANVDNGILVVMSANTTIGGTTTGAGNLITGNKQNGIELENSGSTYSSATLIEGNLIGLDAAGTGAIGNGDNGIFQSGANATTIGGTTAAARNVISGSTGFVEAGISVGLGDHSLIEGNYLGTDITGTNSLGNYIGLLWSGGSNTTVGGTTAATRNVISGNSNGGIDSFVVGTNGYEVIEGNYIGVDVSGIKALPNGRWGIRIAGPVNNTIGGTAQGAGNVISGNNGVGIEFSDNDDQGTVVQGNFIGTDTTGTLALGNQGTGIILNSGGVTIGGTATGAGNIIAYSETATFDPGDGIDFQSNTVTQDAILSNSIYDNAGLGIDFGNGPTVNHPWPPGVAPNSGPNNFQNYPVLSSSVSNNAGTTIQGSLNGPQGTQFLIQFFSSPSASLSGYGQGETYLGSEMVSTPTTGSDVNDVNFTAVLPGVFVLGGSAVTATATDPNGNTSEFAKDITALASATVDVSVAYTQPGPTATAYVGDTLAYTLTVTNTSSVDAPGVVVVDTLNSNVTYQTASSSLSGAMITQAGNTVTANLGTVAANSSATITIDVTVNPGAAPVLATAGSVSNSATLTVPDSVSDTSYTNTGTTSASINTTVQPAADLAITGLTASPDGSTGNPLYAGGTLTYTITAINTAGRSTASNVVVTDYLPANIDLTNISASTSVSGVTPVIDTSTDTVTATFATLTSGTMVTLTVTVVPLASAVGPGLSTHATVFSTAASGVAAVFDPDTTNNTSSTLTTAVTASADLSVAITAMPSSTPLYAGGNITYTITVTNLGPSNAPSVVLTDTIPSDVVFVSTTMAVFSPVRP